MFPLATSAGATRGWGLVVGFTWLKIRNEVAVEYGIRGQIRPRFLRIGRPRLPATQ